MRSGTQPAQSLPAPSATAPPIRDLQRRTRPVALAGERLLPVLRALEELLPDRGLRRGTTIAVGGDTGATSLALALAAGPSSSGSWCAAVGALSLRSGTQPGLGLVAAAELGIALERFPLIADPPPAEWPTVVAALLDAFDVVLAWPPPHLRLAHARRLVARARERGAVLIACGRPLDGATVRLAVTASHWYGLGQGHGRLEGRRLEVVLTGRGAAGRERRATVPVPLVA